MLYAWEQGRLWALKSWNEISKGERQRSSLTVLIVKMRGKEDRLLPTHDVV